MGEAVRPGQPRQRREGSERRLIVIVAEPDFLIECLSEALKRRFSDHEILVDREAENLLRTHRARMDLMLFHGKDATDIARILTDMEAETASISIGILIGDSAALDPIVGLLAEDRHIDGILPLDVRLDVFLTGVELLIKGGEHFPSTLLRRLKSPEKAGMPVSPSASPLPAMHEAHLTVREVEILDLLCKGTQNKLIAHSLKLSENTIKAHVRSIYKKLRVKNRTEAALSSFGMVNIE
ncbi:response regulator transcription factor [Shinella zoogloeoides]|uniref:response regulator transcription factor n=1 Tax=Shinella zoogloeoides TaxID=352475 RepID=UPI000E65C281|nr:response regulator transcription factor [Shinella zoogloeoides]